MKYYLSVLAIFKNEKHIMKEWLLHHMKEGVEHFYLIDNGDSFYRFRGRKRRQDKDEYHIEYCRQPVQNNF